MCEALLIELEANLTAKMSENLMKLRNKLYLLHNDNSNSNSTSLPRRTVQSLLEHATTVAGWPEVTAHPSTAAQVPRVIRDLEASVPSLPTNETNHPDIQTNMSWNKIFVSNISANHVAALAIVLLILLWFTTV
jgi:hypothetical protein